MNDDDEAGSSRKRVRIPFPKSNKLKKPKLKLKKKISKFIMSECRAHSPANGYTDDAETLSDEGSVPGGEDIRRKLEGTVEIVEDLMTILKGILELVDQINFG